MSDVVVWLVAVGLGVAAGAIRYNRNPRPGVFVGWFLVGAVLPLIGLLIAAHRPKPVQSIWQGYPPSSGVAPPPIGVQPAGWYADPHGHAPLRYWDGDQWTSDIGGQ
jgi:hypothetical protein